MVDGFESVLANLDASQQEALLKQLQAGKKERKAQLKKEADAERVAFEEAEEKRHAEAMEEYENARDSLYTKPKGKANEGKVLIDLDLFMSLYKASYPEPVKQKYKAQKKVVASGTCKPCKVQEWDGEPCCMSRKGNSYCGRGTSWLCEEHRVDYDKCKALRKGWYGVYGAKYLERADEVYGKKNAERIRASKFYKMEELDNRPEACKEMYPIIVAHVEEGGDTTEEDEAVDGNESEE